MKTFVALLLGAAPAVTTGTLFVANAWPGLVHRTRELGVHIV